MIRRGALPAHVAEDSGILVSVIATSFTARQRPQPLVDGRLPEKVRG